MNEFSLPMPNIKEHINILANINKQIEKSKITNLYFALPSNCSGNTGFEQLRTFNPRLTTLYDWLNIIEYVKIKGFDFVYLLNSPSPFFVAHSDFNRQLDNLDRLVNSLNKFGFLKYRVTNPQLINYLSKNYPYLEIYASTSCEYKTIKEYQNFIKVFPHIKQVVPSYDVNKNFKLLKNIRAQYPNLDIEIMLNEGCISGCPLRYIHNLSLINSDVENKELSPIYFLSECRNIYQKDKVNQICLSNIIYPWQIEYYNKININKFKLVGRNTSAFSTGEYLSFYLLYLKGIDNIKNIENVDIRVFNNYIIRDKDISLKVRDVKKLLPDIKYFVKYGHLCSSLCGIECKYCYECAKKIICLTKKELL